MKSNCYAGQKAIWLRQGYNRSALARSGAVKGCRVMPNLLQQAIGTDDGGRAAAAMLSGMDR
jgi:hypothetical protein